MWKEIRYAPIGVRQMCGYDDENGRPRKEICYAPIILQKIDGKPEKMGVWRKIYQERPNNAGNVKSLEISWAHGEKYV